MYLSRLFYLSNIIYYYISFPSFLYCIFSLAILLGIYSKSDGTTSIHLFLMLSNFSKQEMNLEFPFFRWPPYYACHNASRPRNGPRSGRPAAGPAAAARRPREEDAGPRDAEAHHHPVERQQARPVWALHAERGEILPRSFFFFLQRVCFYSKANWGDVWSGFWTFPPSPSRSGSRSFRTI